MAVVVEDTFTEASTTVLTAHTPSPTGTSWVEEENTTAGGTNNFEIVGAADNVKSEATEASVRIVATSRPDPTEADVDVEGVMVTTNASSDDPFGFVARWADASNWYSAGTYPAGAAADKKIVKEVTGTVTEIASGDDGMADGDTMRFELRGSALKLFHNAAEVLSVTDSDLSAAGSAGIMVGNLWTSSDDVGQNWDFDNYKVTEFAAAGGAVGRIFGGSIFRGGVFGGGVIG